MAGTLVDLHNALLEHKPEGASHEDCPVCLAATAETAKEEANVAGDETRTFTEAEHLAVLSDAVRRETATLQTEKETLSTEKAALESRVDTLEAEKAVLITERDNAVTELTTFKAEMAEKEQTEARKGERLAKVREVADHLPEDYFTAERATRWAEMSDEAFETAVADLAATKPPAGSAPKVPETAAFTGGESPKSTDSSTSSVGQMLALKRGTK
jgi:chromosome segregation ATPase